VVAAAALLVLPATPSSAQPDSVDVPSTFEEGEAPDADGPADASSALEEPQPELEPVPEPPADDPDTPSLEDSPGPEDVAEAEGRVVDALPAVEGDAGLEAAPLVLPPFLPDPTPEQLGYVESGFALTRGRAFAKRRMIASFVLAAATGALGATWLAQRPDPQTSEDFDVGSMVMGGITLMMLAGGAPPMSRGSALARYDSGVSGFAMLRAFGWACWLGGVAGLGVALSAQDGMQTLTDIPAAPIGVALGAASFLFFGLDSMAAYIQANRRIDALSGPRDASDGRVAWSPTASVEIAGSGAFTVGASGRF